VDGQVLEMMKTYGVKPDHQTFGIIMNAWSDASIEETQASLLRMRDFDLQPDVTAYSILAKSYARGWRPQKAEALLQEMRDQGLSPNVITFTTVISGYCSLALMDDAIRIYQEMRAQGIAPNMNTFHTLIWGFNEARCPRRAEEVLELMKRAGVPPDLKCLELVADCWRSVGLLKEANQVICSGLSPNGLTLGNEANEHSIEGGFTESQENSKPPKASSVIRRANSTSNLRSVFAIRNSLVQLNLFMQWHDTLLLGKCKNTTVNYFWGLNAINCSIMKPHVQRTSCGIWEKGNSAGQVGSTQLQRRACSKSLVDLISPQLKLSALQPPVHCGLVFRNAPWYL
jgi:pentatricopeptide repeat protein